ncbi:MAG TPA: hypothetical protein VKB55_12655 [Nocardioidaceae bacterium]|nr:hypothetical protein [Nocardioidaceae bacterium]
MDDGILRHEAVQRGITRGVLDGPKYEQVSYGVHLPRGAYDLITRCRAIQRVLPPAAVWSHYTAAMLRGWSLPSLPGQLPLFASLPGCGTHLHRRGVYVARTDEAAADPEVHDGLRIASAPAILAQLAGDLSLLDLIAVMDSALHMRETSIEQIATFLRPHQWGAPALRRAMTDAEGRAESWWETPLRLLHVWSGIDVEPQYKLRDDWGDVIARGDLWVVGTRRLHEYDGAIHDEQQVRTRDLGRDKALGRIRWERYGYVARDIVRGPEQIVRDAEDALGLPYRPQRLKRWRTEVARSTLSVAGRRRLARRLQRYDRN